MVEKLYSQISLSADKPVAEISESQKQQLKERIEIQKTIIKS
jgi:hypothetical protein